jgi:glycosyltransferase involved in cell wall biosynthesis
MSLHIGVLTYGIYGERMTGIARYAIELTRALKQIKPDLKITLLNPYPESTHPWYQEFPSYPLPQLKLLPMTATLGNWQLHRAACELKLDILHDPCGIAPFVAPQSPYKRLTTVHDAIPAIYPETQPLLTRLMFQTLIRGAAYTADAIITVSQSAADDLNKHYGLPKDKLHVVYNGIHSVAPLAPEAMHQVLNHHAIHSPYFLYVGALHPRKNIERVIAAFLQVRSSHPQASLVIVGPPSWGAHTTLKTVLTNAEGDTGITFTGYVSDAALDALYQGAQALVFPSLYEGFGLPVLEAMVRGTPVITSTVSSLPEVAADSALLVNPSSTDAIAKAMTELLTDTELARNLSQQGPVQASKFGWEAAARQTFAIYQQLLSLKESVA